MKQTLTIKHPLSLSVACIAIVAMCWIGGYACQAQTSASQSPQLQEVVKLTQAKMTDDVILAYIKNSGASFNLSADDILYLNSQGVSQQVVAALLQTKTAIATYNPPPVAVSPPAPQPPPQAAQQPPLVPPAEGPSADSPEITPQYFHDQLAPFGTWVEVGGVSYWRPDSAVQANPDWRPYYDMGKWIQTDNGLFWQSDYTWGDIPFHYGRWLKEPGMGWLWAPDYTWGPAWVFWRHAEADGAIGWAPLPVGAVFVDGVFMFNGVRVGLDFDFGLGEGVFTFVDFDHFHEGFFRMRGREYRWHIHGDRFHEFYRRSVVRNEFRRDEHGRFVNNGIGRDRMEHATRGRVERSGFEERKPVGDRNALSKRDSARAGDNRTGVKSAGDKTGKASSPGVTKVFRPPTTTKSAAPTSTKTSSTSSEKKKK